MQDAKSNLCIVKEKSRLQAYFSCFFDEKWFSKAPILCLLGYSFGSYRSLCKRLQSYISLSNEVH